MNLTLHMIVKNEEAMLPVCLKSIREFVDEIVVVDTGSNDSTIDIARSFDARVENFTWINDFSAARNYALGFVKTPWTMWLDADDMVLNPEGIPNLLEIARKNRIDSIYTQYQQEASCFQRRMHFFKPKNYKWEGVVHENPMPRQPNLAEALLSDIVVKHRKPADRGPQAAKQYLEILLEKDPTNWLGLAESYKYLYHNPEQPELKNEYRNQADAYYWQALEHPEINDWTRYYCHFQIAWFNLYRSETESKWFDIAIRNAQVCVALNPERAEGWGILGLCWKALQDYHKAIEAFQTALSCTLPNDVTGLVFPAYYDEIPKVALEEIKRQVEAEKEPLIITPSREIIIP